MLIQKLRLQHGWSQQQLADLSGLSVRTANNTLAPTSPGISHEEMLAFNHVRLLMHSLIVFERFSPLGADWEKQQVEKRLGRKL